MYIKYHSLLLLPATEPRKYICFSCVLLLSPRVWHIGFSVVFVQSQIQIKLLGRQQSYRVPLMPTYQANFEP